MRQYCSEHFKEVVTQISFIIVKNIVIIRDIPLKTEFKIGFRCFIIVFFYLLLRFFQHYVYYVR